MNQNNIFREADFEIADNFCTKRHKTKFCNGWLFPFSRTLLVTKHSIDYTLQ